MILQPRPAVSVGNEESVPDHSSPASAEELTARNVALIAEIDAAEHARRTVTDRVVDAITGFCGRMLFVYVHLVWFAIWIGLNVTRIAHFDPYPFNLLSTIATLEAIFLATFILIGQNRQSRIVERRGHLDLQINLLSEQENTRMLSMLSAIQNHLGIDNQHRDSEALLEDTQPKTMLRQIEELIEGEVAVEVAAEIAAGKTDTQDWGCEHGADEGKL